MTEDTHSNKSQSDSKLIKTSALPSSALPSSATAAPSAPTATAAHSAPSARASLLSLMIALFSAVIAFQLNVSMLSPALPAMQRELNTTDSYIGLTQTIFFTSAALFSLFLPRLADIVGRKKVLFSMLLIATVGSVISALSLNAKMLMFGRVLQGAAGPVVPLVLIMLHVRVKDKRHYAKLMAVLTSVNGGIAGIDALLGGAIACSFGFRSVFVCIALACAIAAILILAKTEDSSVENTPRMDWLGVFLLSLAFLCAYMSINELQKLSNSNFAFVLILAFSAIVLFAIFWNVERKKEISVSKLVKPMISTHYLRQRRTWGLLSTTLFTMTGVFAIANGILPKLAQDSHFGAGLDLSVVSFVTLTPYAIIGFIFGPVTGVLAGKFGYRIVLQFGIMFSMLTLFASAFLLKYPSALSLLAVSICLGIVYSGVTNIMLNGLGIVLSPKDNPGYLPGLNAGAFNLGAGLSFALLYASFTVFDNLFAGNCGYLASIIVGAATLALALICSMFIPKIEG